MIEEWKVVPEYSKYEASTTGLIRDSETKELRPLTWNNNFLCTNMRRDDGVKVLCKVHRIVALTFLDNPEQSHNVVHINEDRYDNSVGNLKWKPKLVKEVVSKDMPTLTFLDKTYTYLEFCEQAKCEISVLKHRLKAGWSVRECFTGIKEFTGEGYSGEGMWFTNKKDFESYLWSVELERRAESKRNNLAEKALKRAEKKAKSHCGFGIFVNYPIKGIVDRKPTKAYLVWQGIIARCLNPNHANYTRYGGRGCYVSLKWKYFQDFAVWYEEQHARVGNAHVNWHVDKDILVTGNLEYGPDTCVLVPDDVNIFFASLSDDVKGCTLSKGYWKSGVSILGNKNQRDFNTEEEALKWYCEGKTLAANLLIWKYNGLLEDRVVQRLKEV